MERLSETKIVLIVRETRLEGLKARFNTVSQARFYVEHQGADFGDYVLEHDTYREAVSHAERILGEIGRVQIVHRSFLTNFMFGPEDIVVAIGQDGLVANTVKYLDGQPLIGVNPDPKRYDGQLLPFTVKDLDKIAKGVLGKNRPTKSVTMAKAVLNDGQVLHAVNDLFIGPKSHGSARYTIKHGSSIEQQSSSGVIVSTGLGSTGWFTSLMTGARRIAEKAIQGDGTVVVPGQSTKSDKEIRFAWDADHLFFTVREPFPTKISGAETVFGKVTRKSPLVIESLMPERGVIFSDGVESDFVEFNSGTKVQIMPAERKGILVV